MIFAVARFLPTDLWMALRVSPVRRSCALAAVILALVVPLTASAATKDAPLLEALSAAAPAIDRGVLELALRAAACAARRNLLEDPRTLTVIDYSRSSRQRRLWVLDLEERTLLHEELVAHGKGSGEDLAARFSNTPGSRQSSLGLFATLDTYTGQHGHSLRLKGLEPGVNDHALERAIVIHGASYVSPEFAATHGRLGRSWGCPVLELGVARGVIDRIRGGTALFAYYPDNRWLKTSEFLGACDDSQTAGPQVP